MRQRHQNMTFSMPEDLKIILHTRIGKRGLSRFISNAIRKSLNEGESNKERELDAAYEAASHDSDRMEVLRDWDLLG